MEPKLFELEIVAMMFNVEIELLLFEGFVDRDKNSPIKKGKINFNGNIEESDDNKIKINLFYNFDSYSMFYKYEDVMKYKDVLNEFIEDIEYKNITIEEYNDCVICKDKGYNTNKKILFHSKQISTCYDCLKENCKIYLKERLNSYLLDGCLSRECNN